MTMGFGFAAPVSDAGSGSLTTIASRLPSGAHRMLETPPFTSLTRSASPPALLRSQICDPLAPCRDERNASCLPSGLHRGDDSDSSLDVSRMVVAPSQLVL